MAVNMVAYAMSLTLEVVGLDIFERSCQIGSLFIIKFIETVALKLLRIAKIGRQTL
tara:strand:- start:6994 stop:7161 length:168 start_codon:yes stop_codon:yes gene_type:complete